MHAVSMHAEHDARNDRKDRVAIVVMGVAGSGKSTVAAALADHLGWQIVDADDLHPPENVAKMRGGVPLTDADRMPWLRQVRDLLSTEHGGLIVSCSALRRRYRDILRGARCRIRFLHLDGTPELLASRLDSRRGHFMPATLLDSQLAALEPLEPDEDGVVVDVTASPDDIVAIALERLGIDSTDTA